MPTDMDVSSAVYWKHGAEPANKVLFVCSRPRSMESTLEAMSGSWQQLWVKTELQLQDYLLSPLVQPVPGLRLALHHGSLAGIQPLRL